MWNSQITDKQTAFFLQLSYLYQIQALFASFIHSKKKPGLAVLLLYQIRCWVNSFILADFRVEVLLAAEAQLC